eukprot:UN30545
MKVGLVRPTPLDLPVVELPRAVLFQRLGVDRIALLLKCILFQKRIVLVSTNETELMAAGETLRTLIFPLKWKHLYIPLMNRNVGSKLHTHNGPFLVGVPRFMLRRPEFSKFPKHSIVVFLDKNEIRLANTQKSVNDMVPLWPTEFKRKLTKVMGDAASVFTDSDQNTSKQKVYDTLKEIFLFNTTVLQMTRQKKNKFTKLFAETRIFEDFCKSYKEKNPSDPKLNDVFRYYMNHQNIKLGFSMPARGTLAKIARSTEHYNSTFPSVNETTIAKKEAKHRQSHPNNKTKKRPQYEQCYPEALKFLQQTLLSPAKPSKNAANKDTVGKGSKPKNNRKISMALQSVTDALINKSPRQNSIISKTQNSGNLTTSQNNILNQMKTQAYDNISNESPEGGPKQVLQVLETIIEEAKNCNLEDFQTYMDKIQNLLQSAQNKADDASDDDILANVHIDENALKAFTAHIRSTSLSTANTDSSEESECWDVSDEDFSDDMKDTSINPNAKMANKTYDPDDLNGVGDIDDTDKFPQLNEFTLDTITSQSL